MVEIPPFIQANAFAMYNPGYVHMVDGFVLFQEYAHRMDPLTHEPMGKSRVPGYWSASARRGLLAMLVPRAKAYEKVSHPPRPFAPLPDLDLQPRLTVTHVGFSRCTAR